MIFLRYSGKKASIEPDEKTDVSILISRDIFEISDVILTNLMGNFENFS